VIALLRNAWENDWGGIRTALTTIWETYIKPIFETLWAWLSENIPIALQKLSDFWNNVLLPAIQAVETWLRTVWIPFLLNVLYPWIAETLTSAIQTLSDFWTNTLQPAIEAVWAFINDYLVPMFTALWDLLSTVGTLVITALAVLWETTLKPALEKVWGFIKDNVIPIFDDLWAFLQDNLMPILETVSKFLGGAFTTAWNAIIKVIEYFISLINLAIKALESLKPPPPFTPGSPTPFERGLRGIADAMADLNRMQLPQLQANLNAAGGGNNTTFNLTMYTSNPGTVIQDFNMMQAMARI